MGVVILMKTHDVFNEDANVQIQKLMLLSKYQHPYNVIPNIIHLIAE